MKFILIAIFVAICFYIGYVFSKKYKVRENFFLSLIMLCEKFDVEINYSRQRLKNIFLSFDEKQQKALQGIDKNFLSFIEKENALDKDNLFKGISFLKENEKEIIFSFFKSLGRSDVDSQSKEVKNYQNRFSELSKTAVEENKKYGRLSFKLGIIAGLFIIVLFI